MIGGGEVGLQRVDGRLPNELRPVHVERNYLIHPAGSVLVQMGNTRVICTATIEDRVPLWMRGEGTGWITAEYGMLPGATAERQPRESSRGKVGGRTHEIQRLIGRSLRSIVDLTAIGERTIWIDCDVIQADGGTRTTAITGAFIALADALSRLKEQEGWDHLPLTDWLAATSVGIVDGTAVLDLCYEEDSRAQVDMNVVLTGDGRIVELQGTAEREPFTYDQMNELFQLAQEGIARLIEKQQEVLGPIPLKPRSE